MMQGVQVMGYAWMRMAVVLVVSCMPALAGGQQAEPVERARHLSVGSDGSVVAQVDVGNDYDPQIAVDRVSDAGLQVRVDLRGLDLSPVSTDAGEFVTVSLPVDSYAGVYGAPALPVVRRLFVVPQGAEVLLDVRAGGRETVDLTALGYANKVMPLQPPVLQKPEALQRHAFNYKPESYTKRTSCLPARAIVEPLGIMRGHRLFLLEVRPVDYEPASDRLTVWPSVEVDLTFEGGSGAFSSLDAPALRGVLLNPPPPATLRADIGGNYLIVSNDTYMSSTPMTEFINHKTAQGFTVLTHTVSAGVAKETIKAYIASLWGTVDAPDYLLLVGDIDVIPYWNGGGANATVTDLPYACMDAGDDWYPDMGIGRISINSVSQLQNVVDKTVAIESGNYPTPAFPRRGIFLSGMNSLSGDEDSHNYVIDTYLEPDGFDCAKLYERSLGATTQDVYDAFNAGGGLYSCIYGHASPGETGNYGFANGPDWWHSDIYATDEGAITGFLIQITCNTGEFHSFDECYSEAWLRAPNRGAIVNQAASWWVYSGSHGASPGWPRTAALYKGVFDSIYGDGIRQASDAWQSSIVKLIATYGPSNVVCRDYSEMYNMMGDPSFTMPHAGENYLIVTPPDFAGSAPLLQFVAAKEAQGYHVTTYTVADGTSNTDLKAYINGLWGTADAPRYVLLIGDTDGSTSTTSTIPHFTGEGPRHGDTDWPYVCMGGTADWYPEIPIGRFSVEDVDSLQDVVDKTLFVAAGNFADPDYVKRGAFLANPSTQGQAEPTHNWVIERYFEPNDYDATKIFVSEGGTSQDVTDAVNAGSMFTVYFGHSGSSGWSSPSFSQSSVNALTNTGLYGLVFGWSCNTAHYSYDECFGETWLRAPNKGAAVYISASNFVYWGSVEDWAPSVAQEKAFFASFFEDDIWVVGDAWVNGLYRFLRDYGQWDGDPANPPTFEPDMCRDFLEEFPIFGDPSLELPQPDGFSLSVTPDAHSTCTPPTTEVEYAVEIGQLGTFSEAVTLSVVGAPPGASVQISTNGLAPPFSSVVTIGDLGAVAAGAYAMTITGTSATKLRTTGVDLDVSTGIPPVATLESPADGQTDVSRTPTLIWQAEAQATSYDVEVASDAGFGDVVYSTTVSEPSVLVSAMLDSLTPYYWRVKAVNACGDGGFSAYRDFETIDQADYFTEEFDSFDLENYALTFTPDGSGSYYNVCGEVATSLPFDTSAAIDVTSSISEDSWVQVDLSEVSVALYGVSYDTLYICDGGYITFTGGDGDYTPSLADHFDMPRVSALFHDLSIRQSSSGKVSWEQLSDRVVVTYEDIRDYYNNYPSNTFQIELRFDGSIRITWLGVDVDPCIVGLSQGYDTPVDFVESDLSTADDCTTTPDYTLNVAPASQAVCAPDAASYTITLGQLYGFSEAVTLSANNVPAGASVDFSVNPVTPPGTSVMLIGHTELVAAGDYSIEVNGLATGGTAHTDVVDLSVSEAVPPAVVLTSPADGAGAVATNPLLTWEPAAGATQYLLQVATDDGFANVVYEHTEVGTSHQVTASGVPGATYHWHVRGENECGAGDYSAHFSFTIAEDTERFTEFFSEDDFDLDAYQAAFTPDGSASYYSVCGHSVGAFDTDPAGATLLEDPPTSGSMDDGYWTVELTTPVSFYGASYDTVYVGTNGYLTFTAGDNAFTASLDNHFDLPRIAGAFRDLRPGCGGTISWQETADRLAVTFEEVPEYSSDCASTVLCSFQIELLYDGTVKITWLDVQTDDPIVGLSDGGGTPDGFEESDLSAAPPCTETTGACCEGDTCSVLTPTACSLAGGVYQGDYTGCDPNPCVPTPTGACCVDEVCSILSEDACLTAGGTYQGDDTDCDPNPCIIVETGACCVDELCSVVTEASCTLAGGVYHGDGTDCDPDPCVPQMSSCVIISEVVSGAESGDCPRWIEITNTGESDFTFFAGGIIIQEDTDTDVGVDVDLTGVTVSAGQSLVVASDVHGACSGAFWLTYDFDADIYTNYDFGNGNDRYILTDENDGSNLLDIYGEFGVDGTGTEWAYHYGYAYRLPAVNSGVGQTFVSAQWFYGGEDSLLNGNPHQLLVDLTTPTVHDYDEVCTGGPSRPACTTDLDCVLADNSACVWSCCGTVIPGYCDPPMDCMFADITGESLGSMPNGVVNLTDIVCALDAFGINNLVHCPNADVAVLGPDDCPGGNGLVNLSDILKMLDAFGAPSSPEAVMMCDCPMNP